MWNTICSFNIKHPVHRENRNKNGYVLYNNTDLPLWWKSHPQQQSALATIHGQLSLMQRTHKANFWTRTIILSTALTSFSVISLLVYSTFSSTLMSFICFHFILCDHDKRPAQKELSVTLDRISNIKQTNVFYRSLTISFMHLSILCLAPGKTHTFTEIYLRLL